MRFDREKAKENLSKLIDKFKKELESGRAQEYNEEATKISFIQPLLEDVLGWNVRNHDEVSPEEKVSKGRVDYGLKVEGITRVFIEVKPIKADLDKHIEQAVRYGYNKKSVPFVLLTDFEGIKLFDVTVKPDSRNLLKGLKLNLQWTEYLEQFDRLWLLSKESVIKGELDKLLLVKPKDRLPVDKAILDDLKRWRVSLAKDIFKNNPKLFHSDDREKDAEFLKEITQRILDRIIFMRSCEDRGLTYRRPLKEIFEERTETVGTNTMIFLKEEFKHYNIIFDSDLFRPKGWESNLAIDFKVMRDIIFETYNPYQFDVIPLEVLGNIYEQYLGYTVRLTDHHVKYELKPEVRKAGGIYYTPEYIVDYIVKNTVGKLLQELSAKKIKKLRILDPACGSGSFLIRAYEEMLNYYRSQKKSNSRSKERMRELELEYEEAEPHLTIEEKSEILRKHIFGVDIDEQAVEVTKLSLMMKMLEGEYGLIHGRSILPILDRNIRCGNSLISGDILELKKYFGDEWYEIKPFNWEYEFEKIMVDEGGFDVVIGNPPWVDIKGLDPDFVKYYFSNYMTTSNRMNIYAVFIEKGLKLMKRNGFFGFIIPNSILFQSSYKNLREIILNEFSVINIARMPDNIFKNVKAESVILVLCKVKPIKKIRK
ncbi:Type IIS restriction enzyme Eco57I [subsurface metagenome]